MKGLVSRLAFAAMSVGCASAPTARGEPADDAGPLFVVDGGDAGSGGDVFVVTQRRPTRRVDPRTGVVTEAAGERIDARYTLVTRCENLRGDHCVLPEGRYVPVEVGAPERVYLPDDGRYLNEPTLIADDDGRWHVFSNGGDGEGGPWVERALLHATAPRLEGPWRGAPDAMRFDDPDSREGHLWAPFVMAAGEGYRLFYFAPEGGGAAGLRSARSTDLGRWQRDRETIDTGRDAMVFTLADGARLLYAVGTVRRADGAHDVVRLHRASPGQEDWRALPPALEQPEVCRADCWGFYESPYVLALGGYYYLFVTLTDSAAETYEQTTVYRSDDPTRFDPVPITVLSAHGGEVHFEDGLSYLTRGGWPSRIGAARRGLSRVQLGWARAPD
ncbi:MAG: hypothetical protein JNK72_11890 [Myxococcales bacterium]|nr:hypothetical protein [Myxococcales bacterium]